MNKIKKRILVSACLLGYECNYKGACAKEYKENPLFWNGVFDAFEVIPVCPEQLGGLPTPRLPSELTGNAKSVCESLGSVISKLGFDVSQNFIKGANETLRVAKLVGAEFAVMKSKSPSCGKTEVYDGTFSKRLIPGSGITSFLLQQNKISVLSEVEFIEFMEKQKNTF